MSSTSLLNRVELMACNEAILHFTIGIAVNNNTGIGTGTLVSWQDRKFILTAKHVINGANLSDIRYFVPPPAPLKEHSMLEGIPSEFSLPSAGDIFRISDRLLIDEKNDLVAMPLLSTALIPKYMRFFAIEDSLRKIANESSVLILGFPVDNSTEYSGPHPYKGKWNALGVTSEHVIFSESLQTRHVLHSSFDHARHFLLEYSRVSEGITPPGFSGAVAWCMEIPSPIWTAKPFLAGMMTCWYKKANKQPHLLQGVQGYLVKRLFEQNQ